MIIWLLLVALALFFATGIAIVKSYLAERRNGMTSDVWMFAPVLPAWATWTHLGGWALLATAWLI